MGQARPLKPPPITQSGTAAALLAPDFHGLAHERLCVLNLDAEMRPLGVTRAPPGTADTVEVPVRAVIAESLQRDARKLILAHNHPAGTLTPSPADRAATRKLIAATDPLGIAVVDHLIFAAGEWMSFRASGLL